MSTRSEEPLLPYESSEDVAIWSPAVTKREVDETSESSQTTLPEDDVAIARKIVQITGPVFASCIITWTNSFFTIWLLGNAGVEDDSMWMASYGLANVVVNITGHSFLWGLGGALDTLASQAWGAKEYHSIGVSSQRVVLLLPCLINLPIALIWFNATPILLAMGQSHDIAENVSSYARIRIPGIFCQPISIATQKVLTAMGKTDMLLYVDLIGVPLSMLFTWLFVAPASPIANIFETPINGSAYASTLMDVIFALILTVFCSCDVDCNLCWGGFTRSAWSGWGAYLKLAIPAMLMGIFEWWSWDIVNFLAGLCPDPKTTLATNALLGQIISLAYCLNIGVQQGTQTLVGNAVGAGDAKIARRSSIVGGSIGVIAMLCQCLGLYLFRDGWGRLFQAQP